MSSSGTEHPVFTTRAHVFEIDRVNKREWKPSSASAVPVTLYYHTGRRCFRVISADAANQILINSTLLAGMTFTKTSTKFGQWSDQRAGTVYGLGFPAEADLTKFADQFAKAISGEAPEGLGAPPPAAQPEAADPTPEPAKPSPPKTAPKPKISTPAQPQPPAQAKGPSPPKQSSNGGRPTVALDAALSSSSSTDLDPQALKYENERLRVAMKQGRENVAKWESELQTYKNNNARLKTALQESLGNVEGWKKQLATWKDESSKMKARVKEVEEENGRLRSREAAAKTGLVEVEELKREVSKAQQDCDQLRLEKNGLNARLQEQADQIQALKAGAQWEGKHKAMVEGMKAWQNSLATKISDLDDLHTAFSTLLQ